METRKPFAKNDLEKIGIKLCSCWNKFYRISKMTLSFDSSYIFSNFKFIFNVQNNKDMLIVKSFQIIFKHIGK